VELQIRDTAVFDAVALGEVMLRFDPGPGRIRTARSFDVWEGGGEYNAIRALSYVFGQRTAVMSALVDNDLGRLVEGLIRSGGVDVSLLSWVSPDAYDGAVRNGLNFVERGFGIRGARGISDRSLTAVSQVAPSAAELEHLFGARGVRWFHTGGIYAGLSDTTRKAATAALTAARSHGTVTSVDLNYRPSLWPGREGVRRAAETFSDLAGFADVLIGGESDFVDRLGIPAPNPEGGPEQRFTEIARKAMHRLPNLRILATTVRSVKTATNNGWRAMCYTREGETLLSQDRRDLDILDRVGGGDGFAAGLIYGLLQGWKLQDALEVGAAHGALAMTTPGDNSMASLSEVLAAAGGAGAATSR
jgi:2-dehydro-3-deoxygluconokinase